MGAELNLYNDVIGKRLVLGLSNAGEFTLPDFAQGDGITMRYFPCRPTYSARPPFFSLVDVSGLSLRVGVGPRAGASALLAAQNTWTPVAASGYLEATLDLNTTEMNTAVGVLDSINSYVEIRLNDGAERLVYQAQVKVVAAVIGPTGASDLPESVDSYYTRNELDALFVKWVNASVAARGKSITLTSASGAAQRIIGVSNDGEAQDDIVI